MYQTTLYSTDVVSTGVEAGVWPIIALVLAIIGGILVYFLFVKAKANPKGKFLVWLKKFLDFKLMWVESILKVTYYVLTILVVLESFSLIGYNFIYFLISLICGPIIIRLAYEMIMIMIMIWRNTTDIAENIKKK